MKNFLFLAAALLLFVFTSCDKDDAAEPYSNGVFIIHEGAFAGGTGTVSFYNRAKNGLTNDIFGKENSGATLGNILQSMTISHDKAYLLVNNANKIVLADAGNFQFNDTITQGVLLPRYLVETGQHTALVSQWGTGGTDGSVRVLNLTSNTFTKTIPTGAGADKMLVAGSQVWVVNNGGFASDSTIAIIDTNTETLSSKITVGTSPNSLVQDSNGDVWVLCGGAWGAPNGKLVKIKNNTVENSLNVPQGATSLTINSAQNTLYFIANNAVYQKDLSTAAPAIFIDKPTSTSAFTYLYGLGIDPKTNHFYLADAGDFSSTGTVFVLSSAGVLQDSLSTGIAPANFVFR